MLHLNITGYGVASHYEDQKIAAFGSSYREYAETAQMLPRPRSLTNLEITSYPACAAIACSLT